MEPRQIKVSGGIEGGYVIEVACTGGRLVFAPDPSAQAILERVDHEPVSPAEFEAAYGPVKPSDPERIGL